MQQMKMPRHRFNTRQRRQLGTGLRRDMRHILIQIAKRADARQKQRFAPCLFRQMQKGERQMPRGASRRHQNMRLVQGAGAKQGRARRIVKQGRGQLLQKGPVGGNGKCPCRITSHIAHCLIIA